MNPSFEDRNDTTSWYALKPPGFDISKKYSSSGEHSARLTLDSSSPLHSEGIGIGYLVQDVETDIFPNKIAGTYLVDKWTKGTEKQYLQFVVIVDGADNLDGDFENHQIRYILTSLQEPPFGLANAHFVSLNNSEPTIGEAIYFERDIRQDFIDFWGAEPENFDNIRVLFEVRYDDKKPDENDIEMSAYFDDLELLITEE